MKQTLKYLLLVIIILFVIFIISGNNALDYQLHDTYISINSRGAVFFILKIVALLLVLWIVFRSLAKRKK